MPARSWLLVTLGLSSVVLVVAACVGEDPALAPDTSTTPGNDGGEVPEAGDSGNGADSSDAALADAGADAEKRHCETVSKPLAPTEFFCADFDGADVSEAWTNASNTDGGILEVTTAAFVSAPHALLAHPAAGIGNGSGPQLQWKSVGAKNVVKAELRVHMNPTNPGGVSSYTGIIKLLEITTTNALVALYYSNGSDLVSSPAQDNYIGYFIKAAAFGGAAIQTDYPVTTPLAATIWTDVKLTWQSSGQAELAYNDVSVFNKSLYGSSDTSVTFSVGAASTGDVNEPKAMRYDDVELKLDRAQ